MPDVKLFDGRQVDSASPEWRHECEARAIAKLPTLADRRAWLAAIEHKRGATAAEALRETMKALWVADKQRVIAPHRA